MIPPEAKPYTLSNRIQHYAWGTRDEAAFIPRLLGLPPERGVPYAELWIGAHPSAPSTIRVGRHEVPLDAWIAAYPEETLGAETVGRFGAALPFLFKVLSAGEALSIQAHPNREQAQRLHARDPRNYPDDNHKPEVAVALDSLSALVGVRPLPALREALQRYPEISAFVGEQAAHPILQTQPSSCEDDAARAHALFAALIRRAADDTKALNQTIAALRARLEGARAHADEIEALFWELGEAYPEGDVGLLAIFLLNLVHLEAGQGLYTPAGVPHAYLKGNIIECMANSDNVVRVGLTPKFKDAEALIEILDARPAPVEVLGGDPESDVIVYRGPAAEFEVTRWRIRRGTAMRQITGGRPTILLATEHKVVLSWEGGSRYLKRGQAVFIPALLPAYTLASSLEAEVFRATVAEEVL